MTSVVTGLWKNKSEEFSRLQSDIAIREVSYPNDLFGQAVDLKASAKNLLMLKWKCTVENFFGRLKTEMFYGHEYEFHDYDTFKAALKKAYSGGTVRESRPNQIG